MMYTQIGMSRLKNTFLITVGSERTMFMTIEQRITQKFTVKAYDFSETIVLKNTAIAM